ncbi:MAG: PQQ-dependent sugar dehydrogenase [Steroidobacteraceae bacterium]
MHRNAVRSPLAAFAVLWLVGCGGAGTEVLPADTTAPAIPTGLAASGNTQTAVALTWSASSDEAGGSGLREYVIQRDGAQIVAVTATAYTDSGLTPGTTYTYRVAARDNAGNTSGFSAVIQAATLVAPDTLAPSTPAGLTGNATSSTTVALTWTASTDNTGGSGVQNYVIQRNTVQVGLVTATNFVDTALAASTGYSYRVAARDFAGNQSAFSPAAIVTTSALPDTAPPSVPASLTATVTGTTVALGWTASADTGGSGLKEYIVRRGGVQIALVAAPGTTFNDTALGAGAYAYDVAARDNAGNTSAFSTASNATVLPPDTAAPSIPTGLTATPSGTTVALTWAASTDTGGSGLKEYLVRRGGAQIAIVTATSYSDTGLSAGTYSYDVADRDNAGNTSAFAAAVNATIAAASVTGLDTRPSNTSCVAPARPSSTTGVTLTRTFANLSFAEPVGLVQAPGDNSRWFVLERAGVIRVFSNSPTVSSSSVFLDLRSRINDAGEIEAGLLGLAFHPNFATNGKFYVFYSGPNVPNYRIGSRISEFVSADRQTASLASERELIRAYKLEPNHNGGQLQFGPDGYLYAGFGDGGGANDPEGNGQNRANLFGKIIRIDVNSGSPYAIPPGNPFSAQAMCSTTYSPANPSAPRAASCPEIYAYGLRNPWRFSFDRAGSAADLWVADVGQGGFEEIDKIAAPGGNYGWSIREGSVCTSGGSCATSNNGDPLLPPVQDVPRSEASAIIGGFVYRGSAMSGLVGQYIYANFAPGIVYALTPNGSGGYARNAIVNSSLQISTFGQDLNGEIYAVDFGGGGIYRLGQSSGGTSTIPNSLLATGCVSSTNPTLPASGLIPFGPNAPFWSDGAVKERWMALPNGTSATIGADGDWAFPVGTVLMKNFRLNNQLIETRLFMRHTDGEWAGYTYQWNAGQTDAARVQGGSTVAYGAQQWLYPSEAECLQCHTSAAGRSLSIENGQLNGNYTYPTTGRSANQIATLRHIGIIPSATPDPATLDRYPSPLDTSSGTLEQRARAWLHTNCSSCHRPGGGTNVNMDFRYSSTLAATNTCNADPVGGDLGVTGAKRIAPGDPAHSLVYLRLNRRGANQMPPIGSNVVDAQGAVLVQSWIMSLNVCQ